MIKEWLHRARELADRHVPEEVREGGRRLAERVLERAPERLREAAKPLLAGEGAGRERSPRGPGPEGAASEDALTQTEAGVAAGAQATEGPIRREIDPELRGPAVVVFGYPEDPATQRLWELFAREEHGFRAMDLHQQPAAARQIAGVTGVMVPPYVFIHGRFWGSEGEILNLIELGDLARIIDGDLEGISPEARRIGGIAEAFDDAMTAENIVHRLRLGHIVALEDLDCWCEKDPESGELRVIYEGRPRPLAELPAIAGELAAQIESGELEARWLLEPEVSTF